MKLPDRNKPMPKTDSDMSKRSQHFFGGGEHFSKIFKNCLIKLGKIIIWAQFKKDLTNHALHFSAFGRKTQIVGILWENFENFDENSIEKLNFELFLENQPKIEPSEISPFSTRFFSFEGWTISRSQWLRPCVEDIDTISI